jgi:hypothetical protein
MPRLLDNEVNFPLRTAFDLTETAALDSQGGAARTTTKRMLVPVAGTPAYPSVLYQGTGAVPTTIQASFIIDYADGTYLNNIIADANTDGCVVIGANVDVSANVGATFIGNGDTGGTVLGQGATGMGAAALPEGADSCVMGRASSATKDNSKVFGANTVNTIPNAFMFTNTQLSVSTEFGISAGTGSVTGAVISFDTADATQKAIVCGKLHILVADSNGTGTGYTYATIDFAVRKAATNVPTIQYQSTASLVHNAAGKGTTGGTAIVAGDFVLSVSGSDLMVSLPQRSNRLRKASLWIDAVMSSNTTSEA